MGRLLTAATFHVLSRVPSPQSRPFYPESPVPSPSVTTIAPNSTAFVVP
jgi:hypothetical protein